MQQLRHYMFILPAVLFVATPHAHGMNIINTIDNFMQYIVANLVLHDVVEGGNVTRVQEFINKGANVNARGDLFLQTPLHIAAFQGHTEIAKLLIHNDANVNARDKSWQTPLHIAAFQGHTEIFKLLIHNGANVNARDYLFLKTPLHRAAFCGHTDAVKLLIHNGADLHMQDNDGETPLHGAVNNRNTVTPKLLIHNCANVNVQDEDRKTPLHWAAFWRDTDAVKLLIHNGANVNSQDCSGSTPLTLARSIGRTDITALFDRIHHLLNGNIDAVITDDMPRYNKLYYTKAMIAYGYCDTAHHIISDKLKTLSSEEYADIMLHTVLHRNNIEHNAYHQFITNMRNTYEDNNKRQAVANTAWSCARYGYTAPHVTEWVLNNYENECRNFCDEHGNTIAHLSADTRLNYLQPRIMTLVMQNTNHKPRNADGKTPVMLHHEIGNHEGVDIIKAKIGLEQASRGYTKQYDIKLYHTRIISSLYQLGYIDKPQTRVGFDIKQSRNTTPILGLPQQRKPIADLSKDPRNYILAFLSGKE